LLTDISNINGVGLQEKLREVIEKEARFQKLVEDASNLTVAKVDVAKQLYESWAALHNTMMTLIQGRRDSFGHCDTYHKQLMELTGQLDAAAAAVDDVDRSSDVELSHKLAQSEVA